MALKDLFRPAWKHSDPAVRRKTVSQMGLDNLEQLIEIATTDPEPDIQLLAVDLLVDESDLQTLLNAGPAQPVKVRIDEKLEAIWCDAAIKTPADQPADQHIERIKQEELLVEIACNAENPAARLAAVERISTAKLLCKVAESPCGKEPGEVAVRKITDEELLARLSRKGGNKAVRKLAEKRLKQVQEMTSQPSSDDLREKELNDLRTEAQRMATSWNWDYAAKRLTELEDLWRDVDPACEHPSFAFITESRDELKQRHQEFLVRQKEEHAQAEARQALMEQAESLLTRYEELIGSAAAEAEAMESSIKAEWEALDALPDDQAVALNGRFDLISTRFTQDRDAFKAEQEQLEALETLVKEAEDLVAAEGLVKQKVGKLRKIQSKDKAMSFTRCDPTLLRQRLEAAVEAIDEQRAELDQEQKARHEAQLAHLEELCVEAEGIIQQDSWRKAGVRVGQLEQEWKKADRKGINSKVIGEFEKRFLEALQAFGKWIKQRREEEDWEQWANMQVKEEMVAEIKALSAEEDPIKVGEVVKAAQVRWKEIGPVPRKEAEGLWHRFREACDEQFARTKAHYEAQREERKVHLQAKQEICDKAEALQESTEWKEATETYKALQDEWKATGPGPRGAEQAVWERFRAACDRYFERLREHHETLDAERADNLDRKVELCERAEALAESTSWWDTITDIRELRDRWKEIGPAPHAKEQETWERFQTATQTFFDRLDAARPAHLEAKQAVCDKAKELVEGASEDMEQSVADQLKSLQHDWKETGPGPQEEEKALAATFRTICDGFFELRREHYKEHLAEREVLLKRKHEILDEARKAAEGDDYREVAEKLKVLQTEWNEIGPIPFREDAEIYQEFRQVCGQFFEERSRHHKERQEDLFENLKRKEELCARAEQLAGGKASTATTDKTLDIADQLRIALEANFVMGGETADGRRDAGFEEIKKIQAEWKEIGQVPRKYDHALWRRYRAALDAFYNKNKRSDRR